MTGVYTEVYWTVVLGGSRPAVRTKRLKRYWSSRLAQGQGPVPRTTTLVYSHDTRLKRTCQLRRRRRNVRPKITTLCRVGSGLFCGPIWEHHGCNSHD